MKSEALTAYPREHKRRTGNKKVRAAGRIPAVIYGREITPLNLEVDRKELERITHHSVAESRLVDLTISGDKKGQRLALIKEVQHHPLSGQVLHVDLHEVSETEKVTATIPVETVGEAVGVKTGGGILEHVLFKVRVRALPKDLPEYIQIDVTQLEMDQTIHIGEMTVPPGVEILADANIPVVSVAAPREEVTEEEVAAAPGEGEVEMIKEKKDEGEGAKGGEEKASDKEKEKGKEKGKDKEKD